MRRTSGCIISFISLAMISAPLAAATQEEDPDFAAQKAAVGQALDLAVEMMFKPGALDPNWNKNGVDLEKLVKAKPNQVLVEVDKDGERSISLYSDKSIAEYIPAEWEKIAEIGNDAPQADDSHPIEISELEDGYYVASRTTNYEKVGDADCSQVPASAQLYKVKDGTQPAMSADMAKFIFHGMLERAKPYTVCVRHDVVGEGYRARFFLRDGRSLSVFDDLTGTVTIVPLRPTLELLRGE